MGNVNGHSPQESSRVPTRVLIIDHRKGNIENKYEEAVKLSSDVILTIQPDHQVTISPPNDSLVAVFIDGLTEPEYSMRIAQEDKEKRKKTVNPMTEDERVEALAKGAAVWEEIEEAV